MIEPGIAAYVDESMMFAPVVWKDFRSCPTCRAPAGEPCFALNGRVAGGRPDGVRTPLPRAHGHRRRRVGR